MGTSTEGLPSGEGFTIRPATPDDIHAVAHVLDDAYHHFNMSKGLPPEFPPREVMDVPNIIASAHILHPRIISLVAVDHSGRVIGTNSVDLRDEVAAVGPVAVVKDMWNRGVGRQLMKSVLEYAQDKKCVMLQQITADTGSFCLYASLGFVPVETCLHFQGRVREDIPLPTGYRVRLLNSSDVVIMDEIYSDVFRGRSRLGEISDMVRQSELPETKVKCYGVTRIEVDPDSGKRHEVLASYTTGFNLAGHSLAEDSEAFKALLIGVSHLTRAQPDVPPPTFHLMGRLNPNLIMWLLDDAGLHLTRQTAMMSRGYYIQPPTDVVYLPSCNY